MGMRTGSNHSTLRLTAALRELRAALDTCNISRNALDVTVIDAGGSLDDATATLAHPSTFTTDIGFVAVLAYFGRAALPMTLELAQYGPDGEDLLQQCCLHPGLDDVNLEALRGIDPRRARDHATAQDQVAMALDRLKAEAEKHGFTFAGDAVDDADDVGEPARTHR